MRKHVLVMILCSQRFNACVQDLNQDMTNLTFTDVHFQHTYIILEANVQFSLIKSDHQTVESYI